MKNLQFDLICVMLFCFLFSCKQRAEEHVERISIPLQIVSEDMLTSMPGELIVYNKELIWNDAISDGSIHVIDRKNGKEIQVLQLKGGGPDEVVSPDIGWGGNRRLSVFDYNGCKQIFVLLDSLNVQNEYEKKTVENVVFGD